jgi:hypothetical protein
MDIGREHPFQASGTVLVFILLGAFIGLISSALLLSASQREASRSKSLFEKAKSQKIRRWFKAGSLNLP